VIVNLQPTIFDVDASISIHGEIDDVFRSLMMQLAMPVPAFQLTRWIRVQQRTRHNRDELEVRVGGVMDEEEGADTIALFKQVSFVSDTWSRLQRWLLNDEKCAFLSCLIIWFSLCPAVDCSEGRSFRSYESLRLFLRCRILSRLGRGDLRHRRAQPDPTDDRCETGVQYHQGGDADTVAVHGSSAR
jgi:aromatic ring-cleaving dioxygenase